MLLAMLRVASLAAPKCSYHPKHVMLHVIVLTVALSQDPHALEGVALDWAGLCCVVLAYSGLA